MTTKLHLAITAEGHVVEDMGYDSDARRASLRANNNVPVIPGRKNRKLPVAYDKTLYKLRKNIELFFGKIKIS